MKEPNSFLERLDSYISSVWSSEYLYAEMVIICCCLLGAYIFSLISIKYIHQVSNRVTGFLKVISNIFLSFEKVIFPLTLVFSLNLLKAIYFEANIQLLLINTTISIVTLWLFYTLIDSFFSNSTIRKIILCVGLPILIFHLTGALGDIIDVLDATAIAIGDIRVSLYSISKIIIFGTLLFWLGRLSNSTGKKFIKKQVGLDLRTQEILSKLFEIAVFCLFFILLLQVMGINLTALAVFGGAIAVGLGFGLQSIASNFISGIIILLDRSVSLNDYIEMEDGKSGRVTEMTLRATTLETYDGKDIVVPNEKFISSAFVNWTHKDPKQRYRIDFSVAYSTDVRQLVELLKSVVSDHPQVLSGDTFTEEEQPDCEIDSFGDSGINMFVEFWIEGIDDGKNRVGGDLLLSILETIRENGFEIPFPQREVRIIKPTKK